MTAGPLLFCYYFSLQFANNRIAEGTLFESLLLRGPESAALSIKLFIGAFIFQIS